MSSPVQPRELPRDDLRSALFAGGCFWCLEPAFEALDGVEEVRVGYTGGDVEDPGYREVCSGRTGHYEAVRVVYDPRRVGYDDLLRLFWRNVDPTDDGGQFADRGPQYRTAVFVHGDDQRRRAERSRRELEESGRLDGPVVTEILDAGPFWPAEEEHQDYHEKRPFHYRMYRASCGRRERLRELWGEEAGTPG